jgi:hypothetical protein
MTTSNNNKQNKGFEITQERIDVINTAMAQHGFSGIVNRPTTFKGVRMGEGFKPELVTVQPLTRGTGNHGGPTVSAGGGGGGGRPVIIENIIMIDGRVIDKRIRKVALDGIGMQV